MVKKWVFVVGEVQNRQIEERKRGCLLLGGMGLGVSNGEGVG